MNVAMSAENTSINANISGMIFTDEFLHGFYAGPSLDFSLLENLDLLLESWFLEKITAFRFNSLVSRFGNLLIARVLW